MTTTTAQNPIKTVLNRLAKAGFGQRYVRQVVLPEWWDDEIAETDAGYLEGLSIIARHLGIELTPLYKRGRIQFRSQGSVYFKKSPGASAGELTQAQTIATQALWLTGFKTRHPFKALPTSAKDIREHILSKGNKAVNLANLLDYCWENGIVVLHVCNFPPGAKKMEGLATLQDGRAGIVLCKKHHSAAWMVFLLAHELGHIARGHVNGNKVIVDEAVRPQSTDRQEQEATRFAIELLTGNPDMRFTADSYLNARELAAAATSVGKRVKVDPGVIALNYAWEDGLFAVANVALKIIEPKTSAVALSHDRMVAGLDWEEIPDTNREYISKVTGARIPA